MKMFENLEFSSIPRIASLRLNRPTKKGIYTAKHHGKMDNKHLQEDHLKDKL